MSWWPHVAPVPPQLGCDGTHVPSVEFLLPVARMVPWELAILWTSGTSGSLRAPGCWAKTSSYGLSSSSFWTLILSNCLKSILGVLPFLDFSLPFLLRPTALRICPSWPSCIQWPLFLPFSATEII